MFRQIKFFLQPDRVQLTPIQKYLRQCNNFKTKKSEGFNVTDVG